MSSNTGTERGSKGREKDQRNGNGNGNGRGDEVLRLRRFYDDGSIQMPPNQREQPSSVQSSGSNSSWGS